MKRNNRSKYNRFGDEIVWSFKTENFRVELVITEDNCYQYDGDDEGGEIQEKLNSGEYVAFDSQVIIYYTGGFDGDIEISSDNLGGSVYARDNMSDFWTAHRDRDPMNRNCSIMRAKNGNSCICHYFPDMVTEATRAARQWINDQSFPAMRKTA